jgi:hypothetical protein
LTSLRGLCYRENDDENGGRPLAGRAARLTSPTKEVSVIWWILLLTVLTILSYLADIGVWGFLQSLRVPGLDASLLSVLLLLTTLGILVRMLYMRSKGEKEKLRSLLAQLEQKSAQKDETP